MKNDYPDHRVVVSDALTFYISLNIGYNSVAEF